jgi:excinuclease ABC subunit A
MRPNPIGLTTAKIIDIDQNKGIIEIDFIDADGNTPILDIKAYIPIEDRIKDIIVPKWISNLPEWKPEDYSIKAFHPGSTHSVNSKSLCSLNNLEPVNEKKAFYVFPIGCVKKENKKTYLNINSPYIPALNQLECFGHVQVVWWFNRFQEPRFRRITQVSPPYEKAPVSGVFATRSPVRPNPLALDTVKILNVDSQNGIVEIDSIEAYDKTPFIDLKAYIPVYDRVKYFKVPGWISHWPEWRQEADESEVVNTNNLRPAAIDSLGAFQPVSDKISRKSAAGPDKQQVAEVDRAADYSSITVRGARQHNLKNIDVNIPRSKFSVITGVSGSGKSSLAFDTLHAEGQRRYMDSLSTRAGQFINQMEKPDVDDIIGLNPTIAIEQKTITKNPRSTVGTITGIADYLRILFARIGTLHCPKCGRAVKPQTAGQIADKLIALPPGTNFKLSAPLVESVIDSFTIPESSIDSDPGFHKQLLSAIEAAFDIGKGLLYILLENGQEILVSKHNACPYCDRVFFDVNIGLFSFNSPDGMCSDCNGLGVKLEVDPELIITNPELSLLDGASLWHGNLRQKKISANWMVGELFALAEKFKVDLDLPWKKLPAEFRNSVLYGTGEEKLHFHYKSEKTGRSGEIVRTAQGAVNNIKRLFRKTKGESSQNFYLQFMSEKPCPTCKGERLCHEARLVTVAHSRFPEIVNMTIAQAKQWVDGLPQKLYLEQVEIASEILHRLNTRLRFLLNVGLHYLTLDRSAPSLSGGEGQRIRLAVQLGGGLTGLFYILDEPSIGLHPRDNRSLLDTIMKLRDQGNTVLVVEHDADTMRSADYLLDLGPGAGVLGGELVASGTPEEVMNNPNSLTGRYLKGQLQVTSADVKRDPIGWLTVVGARLHNLKNINVKIPLGMFTCVTGVSGSGKSSLISQTLFPVLSRLLSGKVAVPGAHDCIEGVNKIDKIINITQAPIGRTPRSNPATYTGVFDEIRKVFAGTDEAKKQKFKINRFSFNSKEGRCEVCQGQGRIRIEMNFLPDIWVMCRECSGKRYNYQTLEVKYMGKSIADVLDMDVKEGLVFFGEYPNIKGILQTLYNVGLEYIKLGQSALTLSGGEAQRIKLAKELSLSYTGRTLYILDEPTTGLHFADIQKLLDVLNSLIGAGNTVIVIEHNLDVIKTADWVIDLGPEGGNEGGYIIAQGAPEEIRKVKNSYTGKFLSENYS